MNIRSAKRQAQLQKWIPIIQKCNQSGMRVIDFCASEGITKDAYYYWLHKIREAALESQTDITVAPDKPKLVNITQESALLNYNEFEVNHNHRMMVTSNTQESAGFNTQLTISVGASVIGINQNTPKDLLLSVMEVLAHV